jgi:hypothetical protein
MVFVALSVVYFNGANIPDEPRLLQIPNLIFFLSQGDPPLCRRVLHKIVSDARCIPGIVSPHEFYLSRSAADNGKNARAIVPKIISCAQQWNLIISSGGILI